MISTNWSIGSRCSSANAAWSLTVTIGRSATIVVEALLQPPRSAPSSAKTMSAVVGRLEPGVSKRVDRGHDAGERSPGCPRRCRRPPTPARPAGTVTSRVSPTSRSCPRRRTRCSSTVPSPRSPTPSDRRSSSSGSTAAGSSRGRSARRRRRSRGTGTAAGRPCRPRRPRPSRRRSPALNSPPKTLLTTKSPTKFSSTDLSTDAFAESPMIAIVQARVSPIISAEAVAVVRRGLRSEFWPARLPTVPKSRGVRRAGSRAGTAGRSPGWPPRRRAGSPASRRPTTSGCGHVADERPSADQHGSRRRPARRPTSSRRRSDVSGSAMSSRMRLHRRDPRGRAGPAGSAASHGHQRRRRRRTRRRCAARRPAAARTGRDRTARTAPAAPSPAARRAPRPIVEPSSPSTSASSCTDRITWRREAPSARSSASSRLRWATRIENVLTIRNVPTTSAIAGEDQQEGGDEARSPRAGRSAVSSAASSPVTRLDAVGQHLARRAAASSSWDTPSSAVTQIVGVDVLAVEEQSWAVAVSKSASVAPLSDPPSRKPTMPTSVGLERRLSPRGEQQRTGRRPRSRPARRCARRARPRPGPSGSLALDDRRARRRPVAGASFQLTPMRRRAEAADDLAVGRRRRRRPNALTLPSARATPSTLARGRRPGAPGTVRADGCAVRRRLRPDRPDHHVADGRARRVP